MDPQNTPNPAPQITQNPVYEPTENPAPQTTNPTNPAITVTATQPMQAAEFSQPVINKIWSHRIKALNYTTLVVCLGIMLLIDLPILRSTPSLSGFFYLMIGVVGAFVGCLLFELWAGKKLRDKQPSRLDSTILTLAGIRNLIVILNVIPLIQLLGLLAIPIASLFILANAIMIIVRLKQISNITFPATTY